MLLEDLKVVLKIAELRSITAAATHLDMRTGTASAALKRVENNLGVELFVRTTRRLRLSAAGERYIPQCEQALKLLDQARLNIKDDPDSIEGELRLSLSSDLGRNVILPWLDEFMDFHPKICLKAHLTDSNIDFFRDAIDIALRYGKPKDTGQYGFKICDVPRVLCAAESYVAQYGSPSHPHELVTHNCLFYQLNDITFDVWEFRQGDEVFKIKMSGNRIANDGDQVKRWCIAGKGLATKSSLDVSAELRSGQLVRLLNHYETTSTELWLICASRQSITPAVRRLRDFLRHKTAEVFKELNALGILYD